MESGFLAAVTSATFAVVSGGAGCLAVLGIVAAKMPELRRYRISDGTMPGPPPRESAALEASGEEAPQPAQAR
jgi:hypothetical protein